MHITWSSVFKNVFLKFSNIFVVGALKKKPFFTLEKWKMIFLCNEQENFLRQHCPCFPDICLCIIWVYFNKLCHGYGHNTRHLARKPRIMSKLRGTCSSNLTRFQLNLQKLVFFKRGGWKPSQV